MNEPLEQFLPGQWRIVASSFPMWTLGKRIDPMFTYGFISESDNKLVFSDDVSYITKRAKQKHIRGIDTYDKTTGVFTWRGRGLLKLFKSTWRVCAHGKNYLIIEFSRSLVTPSGIDIVTNLSAKGTDLQALQNEPAIQAVTHEHDTIVWLGTYAEANHSILSCHHAHARA